MAARKEVYKQVSELDAAACVVLHRPGLEVSHLAWHPKGALFEAHAKISRADAEAAHARFADELRKAGVKVCCVTELLASMPRQDLERLAFNSLTYVPDVARPPPRDSEWLTDKYKSGVISRLPSAELVDIVLLQPTVMLEQSDINGVAIRSVVTHPLGNLVFTRDQQIITAKGVILGHMASQVRAAEVSVMRHCWRILGASVICEELPLGARLEGGDFVPYDTSLSFIGVGVRTNMLAVKYLLEQQLFGTERVVVVEDTTDLDQDRMHLDTVFNIVDTRFVVLHEGLCSVDAASKIKRRALVYKLGSNGYTLHSDQPFCDFLRSEGFKVVKIADNQQKEYAINFLNLGQGRIITSYAPLAGILRKEGFTGVVHTIDYVGITNMYGAAHCTSQVARRNLSSTTASA